MRGQFRSMTLAAACAALLAPAAVHAQQQQPPAVDHSAHAAPQAAPAGDCMTAQSKVAVTAASARARLEAARQTNDPAHLRAALDEAMIALGAMLAATEPCRVAAPASMPHAAHDAPAAGAPAAAAPAAAKPADPHAGHVAPSRPAAKPAARPPAKPADPHAGHAAPAPSKPSTGASKPAPKAASTPAAKTTPFATDAKKLVCAQPVDPDTAPSTTYKGKTYYFCSAADRLRFIMNPETALKGGGGQ